MSRRKIILILLTLLFIFVAVPIILYRTAILHAPLVSVTRARTMVQEKKAVLVDVGLPAEAPVGMQTFSWPLAEILKTRQVADFPPVLQNQTLLLLCPGGLRSVQAAWHLWSVTGGDWPHAYAVSGGLQQWVAEADASSALAFRQSPNYEKVLALGAFFGVKTLYTLIAVWLIVRLWRKKALDLKVWRWALLAFVVGEECCFVNVLWFRELSVWLELFHSAGMVAFMGGVIYALVEGLDSRVLHISQAPDNAPCALAETCGGCHKPGGTCGVRRLLLLLLPGLALLALLPLAAEMRWLTYNTLLLGKMHTYTHQIVIQVYEFRYLPLAACVLLLAGWVRIWFEKRAPGMLARMLMAAGCGALGFSLLRLLMVAAFTENQVWFAVWEEMTEMLMIGGIAWAFYVLPGMSREASAPAAT